MKNYNKQQAVKTMYKVMNYLVMNQQNKTVELPEWFTELSSKIQTINLVQDELNEILYLLDKRVSSYFGSEISRNLISSRYMA